MKGLRKTLLEMLAECWFWWISFFSLHSPSRHSFLPVNLYSHTPVRSFLRWPITLIIKATHSSKLIFLSFFFKLSVNILFLNSRPSIKFLGVWLCFSWLLLLISSLFPWVAIIFKSQCGCPLTKQIILHFVASFNGNSRLHANRD